MKPFKLSKSYEAKFSPDGSFLLTIARDVRLWSVTERKKVWRSHPFSHPSWIEFSPDGSSFVVKSTSGQMMTFDTLTGQRGVDFQNHQEGEGSNVCFSNSGEELIDGSRHGLVSVRSALTGEVLSQRYFEGEMICRVLHPASRSFFITEHHPKARTSNLPPENGYFVRWDWPFGNSEPQVLPFSFRFLNGSALSPCGTMMVVTHGAPPREMEAISVGNGERCWKKKVDLGGSGNTLRWSHCGKFIAAVQKGRVAIYAADSGSYLGSRHFNFPASIDFSRDGNLIAFADWEQGLVEPFDLNLLEKDAECPDRPPTALEELIASLGN